jgi:hypothetical protein
MLSRKSCFSILLKKTGLHREKPRVVGRSPSRASEISVSDRKPSPVFAEQLAALAVVFPKLGLRPSVRCRLLRILAHVRALCFRSDARLLRTSQPFPSVLRSRAS